MKNCVLLGVMVLLLGCKKNEEYNPFEIRKISSVKSFQDIRWKDLTDIENQLDSAMIKTLTFNESTIWPLSYKQYAADIMQMGKNPGLGIKSIHDLGITGKNVNVGIIDQNISADYHPEYIDKIVEYYDAGCNRDRDEGSMHGPAVVSLLVGETIGVAPDAKVYYAAAPSWSRDAKFFADALNWIIEKNSKLANDAKIRVVSVSAALSGDGSPFTKNNELWDQAYQKAVEANILVLDCSTNHRILTVCYYDILDLDDITKCKPGWPDSDIVNPDSYRGLICAPSSYRTQAEEYESGQVSFQYSGKGGVSWSVPYLAGVLALGWQVNPNLSKEQIVDYLFETAYVQNVDYKIVNPGAFISQITNNLKQ